MRNYIDLHDLDCSQRGHCVLAWIIIILLIEKTWLYRDNVRIWLGHILLRCDYGWVRCWLKESIQNYYYGYDYMTIWTYLTHSDACTWQASMRAVLPFSSLSLAFPSSFFQRNRSVSLSAKLFSSAFINFLKWIHVNFGLNTVDGTELKMCWPHATKLKNNNSISCKKNQFLV